MVARSGSGWRAHPRRDRLTSLDCGDTRRWSSCHSRWSEAAPAAPFAPSDSGSVSPQSMRAAAPAGRLRVALNRDQRSRGFAGSGSDSWNRTSAVPIIARTPLLGLICFRSALERRRLAPVSKSDSRSVVSRLLRHERTAHLPCAATSPWPAMSAGHPAPAAIRWRPSHRSPADGLARAFLDQVAWCLQNVLHRSVLRQPSGSTTEREDRQKNSVSFGNSDVEGEGPMRPLRVHGSVVRQRLNAGLGLGVVHTAAEILPIRHQNGRFRQEVGPGVAGHFCGLADDVELTVAWISPIRTGLARWWLGSMTAVPPVRFGNSCPYIAARTASTSSCRRCRPRSPTC